MDIGIRQDNGRIGIYKELIAVIIVSFMVALIFSIGVYVLFAHYNIMVDVTEDCSAAKREYDINVMSMVRELDSALNSAVDDIAVNGTDEKKIINDAMKYLLQNNRIPFTTEEIGDMTITITNRYGHVLWKQNRDGSEYNNDKQYMDIEALVANSYDNCSTKYSFVYTKSIKKTLYYIVFEATALPQYIYSYIKLRALCSVMGAFIFIVCVIILIKKQIDYIRYLSGVVNEISLGNFNTVIDIKGKDEITVIAKSIDDMQHNLDKVIREERENDRKNMELITNLSHDIKTPMTIITGYLDIVISGKYSGEEEKNIYLKKAFNQVEKINIMIHKIFVLAKNERLKENNNSQKCNISMLLKQDVSEFEGIAIKEGKRFNVVIPEQPLYIDVDIERIREVLDNILINSIKYSCDNSIIDIYMTEFQGDYIITVSNQTDSFRKSDCERIFDKFYRADHARNSSISGNGLGLSIVKETVESYGGKVWAEYENGIYLIKMKLKKSVN